MKRAQLFASILLLTGVSLAQQPTNNPPDTTVNPTGPSIIRTVVIRTNRGGWWGLLGLFGLAGLLGRRRETIGTGTGYTRDDRTYEQQRRRVA